MVDDVFHAASLELQHGAWQRLARPTDTQAVTVQSSRLFPDARVSLGEVRVDLRVLGRKAPEAAKIGYQLLDGGAEDHFLSAEKFEQELGRVGSSKAEPVQQLHTAITAAVTAATRMQPSAGAPAGDEASNLVALPDIVASALGEAKLVTSAPQTARRLTASLEAMTVGRPVAEIVANTAFIVSPEGTGLSHFAELDPFFQLISDAPSIVLPGHIHPSRPFSDAGKDHALVLTHAALDASDYELGQQLARLLWYQNYFPGSTDHEQVFVEVVGESKVPPQHVAEILFMRAGGFYLSGAGEILKHKAPPVFDMCERALGPAPKASRLINPRAMAADIQKMIESFRKQA